jgi:hypothetical protein
MIGREDDGIEVGSKVDIRYDPDDPKSFIRDESSNAGSFIAAAIFGGAMMLIALIALPTLFD